MKPLATAFAFFATFALVGIGAGLCPTADATEVALSSGYVHLPASSYHYFGYAGHVGLGQRDSSYTIDFGMIPSSSIAGLSHSTYFGSVGAQWVQGAGFVRPYLGLGLGFYIDRVGSSSETRSGFVPALVGQGGLRVGGQNLGLSLGFASYLGIYNPGQLFEWTIWPLTTVMAGIYVAI